MKPVISFSECLVDSPKFRSQIQKNELNLDELETRLEKIIKVCSSVSESGKAYICQQVGENFLNAGLMDASDSHCGVLATNQPVIMRKR